MDRSRMNIAIIGSGRAGGALAIAASRAGHLITSIEGRNAESVAHLEDLVDIEPGSPDLRVVAVSDDAIGEIAAVIADLGEPIPTVHVSGAVAVSLLAPVAATGVQTGSIHPLQTLPDAERGAARLDGAWMAITAAEPLRSLLHEFAASIGCRPFDLSDGRQAAVPRRCKPQRRTTPSPPLTCRSRCSRLRAFPSRLRTR